MTIPTNLRRAAAVAIAGVGVIHLALAPEYFEEQAYVGVLFVLGGLAAALVFAALMRGGDARAWGLGALISVGMGAGFVLSRTVGLPGFHEAEWELSGIVSLLLEGAFLAAAAAAARVGAPALESAARR